MFFDQIKTIDGNLRTLKTTLETVGGAIEDQYTQLDDLAAHIIALEALVKQLITTHGVDGDAVKATIKEWTVESSENPEGSQKALAVAEEFLNG